MSISHCKYIKIGVFTGLELNLSNNPGERARVIFLLEP